MTFKAVWLARVQRWGWLVEFDYDEQCGVAWPLATFNKLQLTHTSTDMMQTQLLSVCPTASLFYQ